MRQPGGWGALIYSSYSPILEPCSPAFPWALNRVSWKRNPSVSGPRYPLALPWALLPCVLVCVSLCCLPVCLIEGAARPNPIPLPWGPLTSKPLWKVVKSNACCGVCKLAYSQDLREAAADIPRDPAAQGLCGMAGRGWGAADNMSESIRWALGEGKAKRDREQAKEAHILTLVIHCQVGQLDVYCKSKTRFHRTEWRKFLNTFVCHLGVYK